MVPRVAPRWRDEPANYETPTPHSRLVLHARRHSRRMHARTEQRNRRTACAAALPRGCREARREARRSLLEIVESWIRSAESRSKRRAEGGRTWGRGVCWVRSRSARTTKRIAHSLSLSLSFRRSLLCPWQTIEHPSNQPSALTWQRCE